MVKVRQELIGDKFGRLLVIKQAEDYIKPSGRHEAQWLCKCDCGNEVIVRGDSLRTGNTQSCGCFNKERVFETSKKYNVYDLTGEFGIGYTSKETKFYFDLEDYELIKDYYWNVNKYGYIYTMQGNKALFMHRLIMGVYKKSWKEVVVDHRYGEKTRNDNRKYNLRLATNQENIFNSKLRCNNTSGVTGVSWNKQNKKWESYIKINDEFIHLGNFKNKEDAIRVRKEAEEKYFGEFSYDNSMKLDS